MTPPLRDHSGSLRENFPFQDEATGKRWWVITDNPATALRVVYEHDEPRPYFGVTYTVERCCVRRATADDEVEDQDESIVECRYSTDEGAVEAFRVVVTDD